MFERAQQLQPSHPQTLYQLSLAYGLARNVDAARATALRLLRVAPAYPGLSQWLAALGLTPPS
jgi:hypothetical protein